MKRYVAALLEVTGLGAVVGSAWLVDPTFGLAATGVGLLAAGVLIERAN